MRARVWMKCEQQLFSRCHFHFLLRLTSSRRRNKIYQYVTNHTIIFNVLTTYIMRIVIWIEKSTHFHWISVKHYLFIYFFPLHYKNTNKIHGFFPISMIRNTNFNRKHDFKLTSTASWDKNVGNKEFIVTNKHVCNGEK